MLGSNDEVISKGKRRFCHYHHKIVNLFLMISAELELDRSYDYSEEEMVPFDHILMKVMRFEKTG